MDGKKVFLVVLLLIALLFGVGVVLVAARQDGKKNPEDHEPGGFENMLDGLLGSLKPRAKLSAASFACGTSTSVGPSETSMRMLKLRIQKGCAVRMTYRRAPHPTPSKLDTQPWPKGEPRDKLSTSFVILQEGGTIEFGACATGGHGGCRVFVVED